MTLLSESNGNIVLYNPPHFSFNRSPDGNQLIANMESGALLNFKGLGSGEVEEIRSIPGHFGGFNDFDWYPWMNDEYQGTDLFIAASKDLPIQLWSCSGAAIKGSWFPKDDLDQLSNCSALKFGSDGSKIIAAGDSKLWIFDANRPGADPIHKLNTSSKNLGDERQTGKLSHVTVRKDTSEVFAVGSFNGYVGIYDFRVGSMNSHGIFKSHDFGVSQAEFLSDGWTIISSGRRDEFIKSWDIRMIKSYGFNYTKSYHLKSYEPTNQRIYFDISHSRSIVTGSSCELLEFGIDSGKLLSCENFDNTISSVSVINDEIVISMGTRNFHYSHEDIEFHSVKSKQNQLALIIR